MIQIAIPVITGLTKMAAPTMAELLGGMTVTTAVGGASSVVAPLAAHAITKESAKNAVKAAGYMAAGGATAAVYERKRGAKRETEAYSRGCTDTAKVYEAKFTEQARKFLEEEEERKRRWGEECEGLYRDREELKLRLNKCFEYVRELEKERKSCAEHGVDFAEDKQHMLKELKAIRGKNLRRFAA